MSIDKIFQKKRDPATVTFVKIELPDGLSAEDEENFQKWKKSLEEVVQKFNDEMDGLNN